MSKMNPDAEWIVQTLLHYAPESEVEVFPAGTSAPGVPLEPDERVYASFCNEMFFSPDALFIPVEGTMSRIPWKSLAELRYSVERSKYFWLFRTADGGTYSYEFRTIPLISVQEVVERMIAERGTWDRETMMPTPTHLRECLQRPPVGISEKQGKLVAPVVCPCGSRELKLLYPGESHEVHDKVVPCTLELSGNFFFRIEAVCRNCNRAHLLIDVDFHGWNGLVAHDPQQAALLRPPLIPWHCLSCNGKWHRMIATVHSQGKDDFLSECDSDIDPGRWPDAFDWFSLSTTCVECGLKTESLIDCETM